MTALFLGLRQNNPVGHSHPFFAVQYLGHLPSRAIVLPQLHHARILKLFAMAGNTDVDSHSGALSTPRALSLASPPKRSRQDHVAAASEWEGWQPARGQGGQGGEGRQYFLMR
jgi:hypothetical protein